MANRQSLPTPERSGAMLKSTTRSVLLPTDVKQISAGNGTVEALGIMTEAGKQYVEDRERLEKEEQRMAAAAALSSYRSQLQNSQTPEAFEDIASNGPGVLKSYFNQDKSGRDFWASDGEKLLAANKTDTDRLREVKTYEFGRQALQQMLADSQNMLAQVPLSKSGELLQRGVDEISASPFLKDDERENYRKQYLKSGILNLALQDSDTAGQMLAKYMPDDADMQQKLAETKRLQAEWQKNEAEKKRREDYLSGLNNSFSLWQQKEQGSLNPAAYYVLTADNGGDMLWAEKEKRSKTPLAEAYKLFRRINNGEELEPENVRDAGNYLINAYQLKQIGLDEAVMFQNQLMPGKGRVSDQAADETIDSALLADTEEKSPEARAFMENKAKLAFEIYEACEARKSALAQEYTANGGTLTAGVLRRIGRQAADEVKTSFGFGEDVSGRSLSFADLNRTLADVYSGNNRVGIWQKFCQEAPYCNDKKGLMKRLAAAEQRRELDIPRFETLDELHAAQLAEGDKFYFQGRLAVRLPEPA